MAKQIMKIFQYSRSINTASANNLDVIPPDLQSAFLFSSILRQNPQQQIWFSVILTL